MRWLRQSTSVDLPIGPFVDSTDGVTAETGLTITQPDIRLKKNGANWAQKNAAQTLTHEENGWYEVTLDATDTNTLGVMEFFVGEAGALPVFESFMVVPGNVWDSMFGTDALDVSVIQWLGTAVTAGTAGVPNVDVTRIANAAVSTAAAQIGVNVVQLSGDAVAADNAEAFFDGTGYAGTGNTIPTVTTVNGLGSNVITAASIATDAITAAKIAADAVTEIRSLVSGTADSGTTTTMVDAARTEADTDYWKGNYIVFTSGTISGQARLITAFNATTDTISFVPATTQAVTTQTYEIWQGGSSDLAMVGGVALNSTIAQVGVNVVNVAGSAVNALVGGRMDSSVGGYQTGLTPLQPTTAGRTLDVSTGGEAGLDWANIGSPTTAQTLSGTTVGTATAVTTVNGLAANSVTAAALAADAVTEIVNGIAALTGADPTTVPAANATWLAKLDWVASWFRNRQTMNRTTGVVTLYQDDGTTVAATLTASDDGTTYTRPEAS